MKNKFTRIIFMGGLLLVVIVIFAGVDYWVHGLQKIWSVPDYYFKNKIPYGFLWGIVGLLLAAKVKNIWLKALTVAGVVAVTLQVRYFIEGYALSFVLLFLLIHFTILYFLSVGMFLMSKKYAQNQ